MVNFYIMRIQNREMTVDEVPSFWKNKVEDKLRKGGSDEWNG